MRGIKVIGVIEAFTIKQLTIELREVFEEVEGCLADWE